MSSADAAELALEAGQNATVDAKGRDIVSQEVKCCLHICCVVMAQILRAMLMLELIPLRSSNHLYSPPARSS